MKFLKIHHPFSEDNVDLIQEYYRERFYGAVTLIALYITILASDSNMSPIGAFTTIFFTVIWLWLAGILASVLSHRVAHVQWKKQNYKIRKTLLTHWGLIVSWIPSLICVSVSILWLITLREALIVAILISLIRIGTTVSIAFMKNDRHPVLNILSICLQIVTILWIIFFKISAEK